MTNGEKLERRRRLERGGGGSENDEEEVGWSSGTQIANILCFSRIPPIKKKKKIL